MLTRLVWWSAVIALMITAEVCFSSLGFLFPAAVLVAFYFTIAWSGRVGLVAGCLTATVVEILMARHGTVIPLVLVVIAGGVLWRKKLQRDDLLIQAIPGLLLGLLYTLVVLAVENVGILSPGIYLSGSSATLSLLKGGLAGAIGLPLTVKVLDALAERLDLEQYHKQAFIRPTGSHDH